jgi:hypothetical protein
VVAAALFERGRLGRDADPRPEAPCLDHGAVGELGAGDAGGKAEVVLDPHGRAGLAAARHGVDGHGVQAL